VFVLICETHTHTYIEEKWNESLSLIQFSVFHCVVFLDLKHTNWKNFETICAMLQQQWNWDWHTLSIYFFSLYCVNWVNKIKNTFFSWFCSLSLIAFSNDTQK
jgi:hypothetical protein